MKKDHQNTFLESSKKLLMYYLFVKLSSKRNIQFQKNIFSIIRKAIKYGKKHHDEVFKSFDWQKGIEEPPPMTRENLYFNYTNGQKYEKGRAYFAKPFDYHENYIRTLDGRWYNTDLQHRMNVFLRGYLIIFDLRKF